MLTFLHHTTVRTLLVSGEQNRWNFEQSEVPYTTESDFKRERLNQIGRVCDSVYAYRKFRLNRIGNNENNHVNRKNENRFLSIAKNLDSIDELTFVNSLMRHHKKLVDITGGSMGRNKGIVHHKKYQNIVHLYSEVT